MTSTATAIQYAGETRRHIFDFSPALEAEEVIVSTITPVCSISAETGPSTMTCNSVIDVDGKEVRVYLTSPDAGRYLIEIEIHAGTIQGNLVMGEQVLKSRLRITVI